MPLKNLIRRAALAALAPTLAITSTLMPATPAAALRYPGSWSAPVSSYDSSQEECADLLYVGVRGSAENDGYGNTEGAVQQAIMAGLLRSNFQPTVRQVYVDYAALSTDFLVNDLQNLALQLLLGKKPTPFAYFSSIQSGNFAINSVLQDSLKRCKNEKWVLSGYSQGALVVHSALNAYAKVGRLAGGFLIGDPANYSGNLPTGNKKGDAPSSARGINDLQTRVTVPTALRDRVYSFCNYRDLVCDTNEVIREAINNLATDRKFYLNPIDKIKAAFATPVARGIDVHAAYSSRANEGAIALAVQPLVASVRTSVAASPSPSPSAPPSASPTASPSSTPRPNPSGSSSPAPPRPFQPVVAPKLLVYTDGAAKSRELDVSSTWWADFKQSYQRQLTYNRDWPADFVNKFETILRNGGSWGVIEYPQSDGYIINFFASADPGVTCSYANNEFRCQSASGATAMTGVLLHSSFDTIGCSRGCSDNGMTVYNAPQEDVPVSFLGFNQTNFYVMHTGISYPDGYSGPGIPTDTSYPLLSQQPGKVLP